LTIGGGTVLDALPLPKLPRSKRLEWLKALRGSSIDRQLLLRIERRYTDGISTASLTRESCLAPNKIKELIQSFTSGKQVVVIDENHAMTASAFGSALNRVFAEVNSKTSDALNSGWKRSELRHRTRLNELVFQFVIHTLERAKKVELRDDRVVRSGPSPPISSAESQKLAALAQTYATAGMNAPLFQSVAGILKVDEPELRRLMTVLLREKVLVKVGKDDLYMHRDVLGKLYAQVRSLQGQLVDVGRFKQLTGLSRKYAIPLLEHLDREHITRKQGDTRLVL
jgi:selenocysteine-specific elongation factor